MTSPPWSESFDEVLRRHLPLGDGPVDGSATLAHIGLDSLETVSLVMDLEETLEISIPDALLIPATFTSANALWAAIAGIIDVRAGR
jgi:acyl carrier protein